MNSNSLIKYKKGAMESYTRLYSPSWHKRIERDLESNLCYVVARDRKINTIYINYK